MVLRQCLVELMRKAVGGILLVTSVVGIHSHLTVKIETRVRAGHEWTVDGHLMKVDANPMILRIAVEEHAELK
jgi:hypothetical protein